MVAVLRALLQSILVTDQPSQGLARGSICNRQRLLSCAMCAYDLLHHPSDVSPGESLHLNR